MFPDIAKYPLGGKTVPGWDHQCRVIELFRITLLIHQHLRCSSSQRNALPPGTAFPFPPSLSVSHSLRGLEWTQGCASGSLMASQPYRGPTLQYKKRYILSRDWRECSSWKHTSDHSPTPSTGGLATESPTIAFLLIILGLRNMDIRPHVNWVFPSNWLCLQWKFLHSCSQLNPLHPHPCCSFHLLPLLIFRGFSPPTSPVTSTLSGPHLASRVHLH